MRNTLLSPIPAPKLETGHVAVAAPVRLGTAALLHTHPPVGVAAEFGYGQL